MEGGNVDRIKMMSVDLGKLKVLEEENRSLRNRFKQIKKIFNDESLVGVSGLSDMVERAEKIVDKALG